MMQCSLNEVETLLIKAARGCGADAALAAKFAGAALHCLAHSPDTRPINAALAELPSGVIIDYAAKLQDILSQAIENTSKAPEIDALWDGYIAALPYRTALRFEGGYLIHLDQFERLEYPPRLQISVEDLSKWKTLAAKTFVPESTRSRSAGAGAGLTDND